MFQPIFFIYSLYSCVARAVAEMGGRSGGGISRGGGGARFNNPSGGGGSNSSEGGGGRIGKSPGMKLKEGGGGGGGGRRDGRWLPAYSMVLFILLFAYWKMSEVWLIYICFKLLKLFLRYLSLGMSMRGIYSNILSPLLGGSVYFGKLFLFEFYCLPYR